MNILSHRGYWQQRCEQNQAVAFQRAFDLDFGVETDVRDRNGELVISHDMPGADAITLVDLLEILGPRDVPLALNIKADGLGKKLQAILRGRSRVSWFTFDMSVPEAVAQMRLGLPVFTRVSEHERHPVLYHEAQGIWLDSFVSDWFAIADIESFLRDGKRVAVVSPELHGRPYLGLWQQLRNARVLRDNPALMLCTDLPEAARGFF